MCQFKWARNEPSERGSHTPAICKWAPHPAQTVWPYSTPLTSQLTLQGRTISRNFLKTTLKYFLLINLKLEDSATSFSSLIIPMSGMKPSLTISPLKKEGICNGWKVKIKEPCDPDITIITVNIYKNGTVMVQGNLKTFQADYITIMNRENLLPEYLSSEQNTQGSSPDLKPTPAERPAQDPSSPLLNLYLYCRRTSQDWRWVQLRETVLKQEHHTELQQNSEHITRLSALTQ